MSMKGTITTQQDFPERDKSISITAISDLHGYKPKLKGGDMLIVGGDWTARDKEYEVFEFFDWLYMQPYTHKILVAGNHDNLAQLDLYKGPVGSEFTYLCDSGCQVMGINIWGTPWTKKFFGQSPKAMAFSLDTDEQLMEKWSLIPMKTDILVTHSPPYGILDYTWNSKRCGCKKLRDAVCHIQPHYHIFGHLHNDYGKKKIHGIKFINASHVNDDYEPVNEPIRITYGKRTSRGFRENCSTNRSDLGA